ncbi:hypothetical protein ACFVVM_31165 [Nocardia sp. NPDC058176]|uniref:hypothetical protein n=1 Tax=Nocardia sp. NPDC058176 TaxID=3346368 RepID=UPI0036DAEDBF
MSIESRLRTIAPHRSVRLRAIAGAVAISTAALVLSACAETSNWGTIQLGDCGYFAEVPGPEPWKLEHRDCTDPEAALVVVRGASTERCADEPFSSHRISTRGATRNLCTQLNAQVGDCYNDIKNRYAHLVKLRKVPCSTPQAHQVNTRVDSDDYGVCDNAKLEYGETEKVQHKQPPASFCLHRIGT